MALEKALFLTLLEKGELNQDTRLAVMTNNKQNWLALAIGNSRLHWGYFKGEFLVKYWDTPHLSIAIAADKLPEELIVDRSLLRLPVYLASVVPKQTKLWQSYRQLNLITLKNIQLTNLYPSLGVDRALAVSSAVKTYNLPCLIIDGGTALTFTAADTRQLIGGAILPGLRSQFASLNQRTAALPEINIPNSLPARWALNTDDAISSGIIHSAISGINSYILDWRKVISK